MTGKDLIPRAAVEAMLRPLVEAADREYANSQSEFWEGALSALQQAADEIQTIPPAQEGEGLREALDNAIGMLDYAAEVLREREIFGTAELMSEVANSARATLNKGE